MLENVVAALHTRPVRSYMRPVRRIEIMVLQVYFYRAIIAFAISEIS